MNDWPDPLVFGHRGCSADAPENTLAAFSLIRERGVPGVELDVYRCGSGEIVVCHDRDLSRTGGIGLDLVTTPYERLSEVDVGSWFSPSFAGERLPLLETVFELLGRSVIYDIEIKHVQIDLSARRSDGVEAAVAALVHHHNLASRCLISSFDPFVLRRMARVAPDLPRAAIYAPVPPVPRFLRNGHGARIGRAAILKPHFSAASTAVSRFSSSTVIPWTVDDPERAATLIATGAGGIISNRPDLIIRAIAHL